MRILLNELKLVYPPFSNREGEWLWEDKEVREYVKDSKLYMIGHRRELKFTEYTYELNYIKFKIKMDDTKSPFIKLFLKDEIKYLNENHVKLQLEIGDKLIRIKDSNNNVLKWFTPDAFLFKYWRNALDIEVEKEFDFKKFTEFELYYVGISLENDSFSRLFKKAHHGRLKILSMEDRKEKESNLTDELYMFLFDISNYNINTIEDIGEFEENLNYYTKNKKAIIADAEKAFVNLLDTKYNKVKFKSYPLSKDGLYSEKLDKPELFTEL